MPQFKSLDKMMKAIHQDLAEQTANLTRVIGDAIVDNVTKISQGRIPPPKILAATKEGIAVGYTGKESKEAIREEINGTRPMANTINQIRANLAGLLKKRGIRGVNKS